MERVTSPHLQIQLRGLDSAIRQATQATHTALHYTHELITTFGLIHTLNSDTNQLEAELCGATSFRDHRIPPPRPPPRPPSSSTTITSTPDYDSFTVRSFVRQLRLPLTAYQTYRALRQFN